MLQLLRISRPEGAIAEASLTNIHTGVRVSKFERVGVVLANLCLHQPYHRRDPILDQL